MTSARNKCQNQRLPAAPPAPLSYLGGGYLFHMAGEGGRAMGGEVTCMG